MANLNWSQSSAVESIPGKQSGAWMFKDTRMPVATVFENLEDMSVEDGGIRRGAGTNRSGTWVCGSEP